MKLRIALIVLGVIIVAQIIPVKRDNPQETGPVQVSEDLQGVLTKACLDCHSNQTVWPWYSKVAPVSWVIARHVKEGREHLNFSDWENLEPRKKDKLRAEIYDEVAEGEMPPKGYLQLHPEARISGSDLNLLKAWAR